MKQLKVVVNDTPSNLLTQAGGYVTANFINPVEVKKGSLICLDKFNATSKNISQNFGIVSQTFTIGVNVVDPANPVPFDSVTIAGGSYATIVAYIAAVNQAVNAQAVSAFRNIAINQYNTNFGNVLSQGGIGIELKLTDGLLASWTSKAYGISPISTSPSNFWSPSLNSAIDVNGYYYSTDTFGTTLISDSVIQGGGLLTLGNIKPVTNGDDTWTYAISTDINNTFGGRILQKLDSVNIWVQNDQGIETEIANSQALFPGAYAGSANCCFMIFQSQGKFRLGYYNDITNPDLTWYVTDPAIYDMGNWYYSSNYKVFQVGSTDFNGFGNTIYTPTQGGEVAAPYPAIPFTSVSLSNASQFALVFGFKIADNQVFKIADNAIQAILLGTSPSNALQLRSAFELAIEIIDLPLKTYFAQSGTTNKTGFGGRQNVVCYFTPTSSIEAEGLYSFSNSVHQWLDIDNSADTTLHSLSFRVFNAYTGDSFISNSMGFNLLIKSPDERMEN